MLRNGRRAHGTLAERIGRGGGAALAARRPRWDHVRVPVARHGAAPHRAVSRGRRRVDHPSVSREHAALHVGAELCIEDLGSANGTRVREAPLAPGAPVESYPDDVVDLGAVLLVVQYRGSGREAAPDSPPRRARAAGRGGVRARRPDVLRAAALRHPARPAAARGAGRARRRAARAGFLATAGGGRFDALVLDVTPDQAEERARRVIDGLAQRKTTASASCPVLSARRTRRRRAARRASRRRGPPRGREIPALRFVRATSRCCTSSACSSGSPTAT